MRSKKTIVSISRAKTIANYIIIETLAGILLSLYSPLFAAAEISGDCPQTNGKIYDVISFWR